MKKFFIFLIGIFAAHMPMAVHAASVSYTVRNDIKTIVNGEEYNTRSVVINDRTYLSIRELSEILGLYITWDDGSKTVKVSDIGITVDFDGDSAGVTVDSAAYETDFKLRVGGYEKQTEIYSIGDRAYVPLRKIGELTGAQIEWDGKKNEINIQREKSEETKIEPLLRFVKDDKFGFLNKYGETAISNEYLDAEDFSEGLAAVCKEFDDGDKFGYINSDGEIVIPFKFRNAASFSDGFAVVIGEYGNNYIDKNGDFISDKEFFFASDFNNGLAVVTELSQDPVRTYIIDGSGRRQSKISEKFGEFIMLDNGYVEDPIGRKIYNRDFETVFYNSEYTSVDYANGFIIAKKDGKYGVVDLEDNIIIDFKYKKLEHAGDGLFIFADESGNGYMDINENVILPAIYETASAFENGIACVGLGEYCCGIDKRGNILYKIGWDELFDGSEPPLRCWSVQIPEW